MAYTVLIKTKETFTQEQNRWRTRIKPATYWLYDQQFTCFSDMKDWIERQEFICVADDWLRVEHIESIEPFSGCMCED